MNVSAAAGSVTSAQRPIGTSWGLLAGAPPIETVGATFRTVIVLLAAATWVPSSSARSTVIVYGSDGVPVGLSSA